MRGLDHPPNSTALLVRATAAAAALSATGKHTAESVFLGFPETPQKRRNDLSTSQSKSACAVCKASPGPHRAPPPSPPRLRAFLPPLGSRPHRVSVPSPPRLRAFLQSLLGAHETPFSHLHRVWVRAAYHSAAGLAEPALQEAHPRPSRPRWARRRGARTGLTVTILGAAKTQTPQSRGCG